MDLQDTYGEKEALPPFDPPSQAQLCERTRASWAWVRSVHEAAPAGAAALRPQP